LAFKRILCVLLDFMTDIISLSSIAVILHPSHNYGL
jgi:hypothetical protein